jgi:hypothetical protein
MLRHPMTTTTHRGRQVLGAALSLGLGLVTLLGAAWLPNAAAQTKPHPHPKPKASASAVPAPTAAAAPSVAVAVAPGVVAPVGSTVGSTVAAVGPVPAPRVDPGVDGGRASPLNPTAEEMPGYVAPGAAPAVPAVDYDKLLGDIAALRARVADIGDALFVSRIVIALETDGDHAKIGHLTLELDDGVVYTAPASFHASDPANVYEHAVAPGHHAVTVEVDRKDDRDDTFRDLQRTRFIVDVPKDQRLAVTLRIGDDSDMGGSFPGDHRGKYDLRVRMKAAATPVKR